MLGASGAGKSTLLQIMGTLDRPTNGRVMFKGQDVFSMTDEELAQFRNEKMGFVFQFHHLLPEFTALENVCIPSFIGGFGKQDAVKKAEKLLSFLKLTERKDHKPSQLSGGEQQRVAIARQ